MNVVTNTLFGAVVFAAAAAAVWGLTLGLEIMVHVFSAKGFGYLLIGLLTLPICGFLGCGFTEYRRSVRGVK